MAWDLEEAMTYYQKQGAPSDQSAVIGLLREIQQEQGNGIPASFLPVIARRYGIRESFLLALIKRLPSLRLAQSHCLELCAGPNCGKHTDLAAFAEKACQGKAEVKFVPCMRMCGKGPNLRWDGKLYHRADEALILKLLEER